MFDGPADEVVLPAHEGYMGILPGHLPVLALTKSGTIECFEAGKSTKFFVSEGYFELHDNQLILLVRSSEPMSAIDAERAKEALNRAEQKLKAEVGITEAEMLILMRAKQRALARIDIIDKIAN